MPSWPTAFGGMLAAGYAATQAQKVGIDTPSALVASALRTLGNDTGYKPPASGSPSGSAELNVLQGEVDRLHKLLADVVRGQGKGQGGYTVIHTGRGGWAVLILPAAVAGGVLYLYVKIRGVSVSDFFMVTNRSLQSFRDLVSQSMTQLWEEVRKQKDEFLTRIAAVGSQQQQMMKQQGEMDEKLQAVSTNVEDIRDISNKIDSRVGEMDNTIKDMSTVMRETKQGIMFLCATVADVSQRIGMDSSRLRSYVQSNPLHLSDSVRTGLGSLLEAGGACVEQPLALGSSASLPNVGLIVEEPDSVIGVEASSASSVGGGKPMNGGGVKRDVLYRRDSGVAGRGGLMGSFWGSGGGSANSSGNRSRAVTSLSH